MEELLNENSSSDGIYAGLGFPCGTGTDHSSVFYGGVPAWTQKFSKGTFQYNSGAYVIDNINKKITFCEVIFGEVRGSEMTCEPWTKLPN